MQRFLLWRAMLWCMCASIVLCAVPPLNAQQAATESLRFTLADAIDVALSQGFEAQAAEATRDASRYRHDAFYSRLLPQFSLSATAPAFNRSIIEVLQPDGSTQFRSQDQTTAAVGATVSQVIPFTGGDVFVSSSLTRISVSGAQEALTWSSTPVTIGLRQPIFRPNTVGWDKRAQPVRTEVAEREYLEAREDLALRTTGLFFDVHAAQVALATALANVGVNDTLYTLNKGRYEIGRIGENDLLQSELALLRAQTDLDAAQLELQRALAAFRIALNISPERPVGIDVATVVPDLEPDTAVAMKEALQNASAIANLELQDVEARRRVAEAKLNNGVGAVLEASYGFNATGSRFRNAYENLLEAQQLTFSVEVPLIQWGARKAEVRAAEMDLDQVTNTTQALLDQAAHEARFAARRLAQARRALLLSAKADTVAQKRFEVAYNRYVIGRISIDNLFIAQSEKDQARRQYVRSLRGYWEAYYWLRRVTLYDFERGQVITGR